MARSSVFAGAELTALVMTVVIGAGCTRKSLEKNHFRLIHVQDFANTSIISLPQDVLNAIYAINAGDNGYK